MDRGMYWLHMQNIKMETSEYFYFHNFFLRTWLIVSHLTSMSLEV
uniref:Uncharacterized protein n=1 Tax=Anguilla anguilla TaxID=7936 RepID=A0A0E9PL59_ANGAN